jgi:hypothetical protein
VDRAISVLSVIVLGFIAYLLSPKTKSRGQSGGQDDAGKASDVADKTDSEATTA